ncbi:hypothetical protein BDV29DRAFT_158821 [Aspergillus leporis]|jgi:hypothetical protein|uniref:MARVEL domain-containing protein n=1 Tax=Aspergillus leporis TaxID=41062 RepID=A0A5N5WWK5_9EURO|nr:hypothetical protein BDV29DRAFT_158821 [Aspergillus leporis]
MWWLAFNALKFGASAYKKHKKTKNGDDLSNPSSIPMSSTRTLTPQAPIKTRLKAYTELALHFLTLVFGLTVIGLYGRDVHSARKHGDPQNAKWVYAVVTGSLGAGTALVYLGYGLVMMNLGKLGRERKVAVCLARLGWGFVVVILWLVVFGVFGGRYIGVYGEGKDGDKDKTTRMRRAVWIDLINLVFWVGIAGLEGLRWWKLRSGGRAVVDEEPIEKEVSPV